MTVKDFDKIFEHNNELINSFGKTAQKHFNNLLDGAHVTGKIELVDKRHGKKQHEDYGMFRNIYVDQWGVGMDGDSFEGFIYANVKKGQWIKIPYVC